MGAIPDSFTLGIEEEYLLVDAETMELAEAPQVLIEELTEALGKKVSREFLRCQVEVGTGVCQDIGAAREDLRRLRGTVAEIAAGFGLTPIAASCHPFANWREQRFSERARYQTLARDMAGVALRMLICGMHVHVGLPDNATRIDLMRQMPYFLPHLLALSASSPLWQGQDTGLASYRLTVFDNLPRTGLPPDFTSWDEYQRSVDIIIATGLIEDATKIWWDLRPSARFPTLESRICDVLPRLEQALSVAALTQSIMRMLCRLRAANQRWRIYDRFLIGENRWRAQRYGVEQGMIDFGRGEVVPFGELLEELIEIVTPDAEALGCLREVEAARDILIEGPSAERQRRVFEHATGHGASAEEACRAVVRSLVEEYHADL